MALPGNPMGVNMNALRQAKEPFPVIMNGKKFYDVPGKGAVPEEEFLKSQQFGGDILPPGTSLAQVQQFPPEALELFKSLFPHVGPESQIAKLARGEPGAFEQLEAPAHRQFQEKIGELGHRFGGRGMSTQMTSGRNLEATQAASDFAQKLQADRLGLQREAFKDLGSMAQMLMGQRPFERGLVEKPKSFGQELGIAAAPGAMEAFIKLLPIIIAAL